MDANRQRKQLPKKPEKHLGETPQLKIWTIQALWTVHPEWSSVVETSNTKKLGYLLPFFTYRNSSFVCAFQLSFSFRDSFCKRLIFILHSDEMFFWESSHAIFHLFISVGNLETEIFFPLVQFLECSQEMRLGQSEAKSLDLDLVSHPHGRDATTWAIAWCLCPAAMGHCVGGPCALQNTEPCLQISIGPSKGRPEAKS